MSSHSSAINLNVRVAIVIPSESYYSRLIQQGIVKYAYPAVPWNIYRVIYGPETVGFLERWQPHGIMAQINSDELVQALGRFSVPIVNFSGSVNAPQPGVFVNDMVIGEVAARHVIDRGVRCVGFVGFEGARFSRRRREGFIAGMAKADITKVEYFEAPAIRGAVDDTINERDEQLTQWLKGLSSGCAVFACNDVLGRRVTEACRLLIRVPDEVAVLGCDNDELLCRLAHPGLSSVELPFERVGYESAVLLDKLMRGENAPAEPLLLPPVGVVSRPSTDTLSVSDPEVAAAVRFIRAHAGEFIGVPEVVLAVRTSRRTLERRFRAVMGRSVLEEIRRVRLDCAKEMLANTDLPMPLVAHRSGFTDNKQLAMIFHEEIGTTPTAYRKQFRLHEMVE